MIRLTSQPEHADSELVVRNPGERFEIIARLALLVSYDLIEFRGDPVLLVWVELLERSPSARYEFHVQSSSFAIGGVLRGLLHPGHHFLARNEFGVARPQFVFCRSDRFPCLTSRPGCFTASRSA